MLLLDLTKPNGNLRAYDFMQYGYSWMLYILAEKADSEKLRNILDYWNRQGGLWEDDVARYASEYTSIAYVRC